MPVNAQEKVREMVEKMPNLIKIVRGAFEDRVIRVIPLESKVLWLDIGPDAEEWARIRRLIFLKAPLEQRNFEPVPVGNRLEWTLVPEDVPVIVLQNYEESKKEVKVEVKPVVEVKTDALPVVPKKRGRPRKIQPEVK